MLSEWEADCLGVEGYDGEFCKSGRVCKTSCHILFKVIEFAGQGFCVGYHLQESNVEIQVVENFCCSEAMTLVMVVAGIRELNWLWDAEELNRECSKTVLMPFLCLPVLDQ